MSHAAIVNPLANLSSSSTSPSSYKVSSHSPEPQYQLSSAPQMPMLKPAPNVKSHGSDKNMALAKELAKLTQDGKPIKKGELDPSTMVHVPGGE